MGRWGYFITFEGIEGSGKSTLARKLYEYLTGNKFKTILTREPGGTKEAEEIREVLLKAGNSLDPVTELLLMLAARRENVYKRVLPALRDSYIVISDRFDDSSYAYQGFGRGLELKFISRLNKVATGGLKPNLTFLVDIPPEMGFSRMKSKKLDRIELEDLEFHTRVRKGYLILAKRAKKRFHVLNGEKSIDELMEEVIQVTLERLEKKGIKKFKMEES